MHVINPYERFDVEDSDVTTSGDYENDYYGPIDGVIISDDEDYNIEYGKGIKAVIILHFEPI